MNIWVSALSSQVDCLLALSSLQYLTGPRVKPYSAFLFFFQSYLASKSFGKAMFLLCMSKLEDHCSSLLNLFLAVTSQDNQLRMACEETNSKKVRFNQSLVKSDVKWLSVFLDNRKTIFILLLAKLFFLLQKILYCKIFARLNTTSHNTIKK